MVEYIYFVKCADCEDEPFEFFDKAKDYALSCMSKKPVITQIEVNRNDFGECVDSCDLGTVWSWEEAMRDIPQDDTMSFSKADTFDHDNFDTEFDDTITFETDCVVNDRALDEAYYAVIEVDGEEKRFSFDSREDAREYLSYVRAGKDPAFKGKKLGSMYTESCRKAIPEGMTIEALVEAIEENEDMVECKECYDLYAKQDCTYEEGRGYVCSSCSSNTSKLSEAFNPKESAELYYDELTAIVTGNQRDADDWDEAEFTSDYTYKVEKGDVAVVIFENFMTDEDVKDVPGGFEALEDESIWMSFLEYHFDDLFDKYYEQLLVYYKDDAEEAFCDSVSWDDYQELRYDRFDESCATKSVLEELEESEDYRQRLTMCPECGTDSFDLETGICINCGFSTLTEDTDTDADMPDYLKILKLKKMSASQLELERKGMETFIINSIDKCKKAKAANWSTTTLCVPNGLYTYDNMREATQYIFDELAKAGFPGGEVTPHDKRLLLIPLKDDADLTGLAKDLKDKEDKILRNFNPNDPISAGRRAAAEFERSPYDASSFRKPLDDGRIAAHKAQGDR
jgi:hypothetical protein